VDAEVCRNIRPMWVSGVAYTQGVQLYTIRSINEHNMPFAVGGDSNRDVMASEVLNAKLFYTIQT
jgi:hypothetical protein